MRSTHISPNALGAPGNRPSDFVPHPHSSPLGLFSPKILSSKLILIIGVYYHRSCSHTVAKISVAARRQASSLAPSALLGAFENFAPCRASFVAAGRRRSDDDLICRSLSSLVRALAQLSGRGRSPGADVGERPKPPCGSRFDNCDLTAPRMDSRAATTTPGPMGRRAGAISLNHL